MTTPFPFSCFFRLTALLLGAWLTGGGPLRAQAPVKFDMVKTTSPDETFWYGTGQADLPSRTPWILERALDPRLAGGQAGGWFPMAAGSGGSFPTAPESGSSFLFPVSGTSGRDRFEATLLTVPVTPPPPPSGNEVGFRRLNAYRMAHVSLRRWSLDGTVVAQWKSLAGGSTSMVTAVFPASQMDISEPDGGSRFPFGVGCLSGPSTDAVPLVVSYFAYDLPQNPATFTSTSSLDTADAAVKTFLVNHQAEIKTDLWPPLNAAVPPPASPVTLDQRSFFRLRTETAPSLNSYGVPSAIAASSDADTVGNRKLRISEVCYSRTAAGAGELIGGEAADWVEIWNASSSSLSTANYYLSDSASKKDRFRLPVMTLAPGQFLVIHCTSSGRERLAFDDPLLAVTADFDLKVGDTVYLNYKSGSIWSTFSQMPPSGTVIPPAGSVSPAGPFPDRVPPNISYGIRQSSSGAIGYGWFAGTTQGGLNSYALLTPASGSASVVCGDPAVEDAASPLAAPVALKGKFFSTGSMSVRLRASNTAETLLYTLNGTEPTGQSAVYDPAVPLTINGTTVLKVKAVRSGLLPSATVTRTFIHVPTVATQLNPLTAGQPLCDPIIAGTFADSAGTLAGYSAAGGITAQLTARPAIAVSYSNGVIDPVEQETVDGSRVTVEFIDPANAAAYSQEGALIKRSGNHSVGTLSKHSWHLLFKKSVTLKGTDRWQPPTVTNGGVTTSVLFPPVSGEKANPVTTFSRLQLRGGSTDGYSDGVGGADSDKTHLKDWWLRESQRAQGSWTPRCRPVSLFLNGLYWGVYNLGERPDSDCVSDWLCSQPGLTLDELKARAPDKIRFLRYDGLSAASVTDSFAGISWNATAAAAKVCYQNPGDTAAWDALSSTLEVNDYIDYMITLHLCGKGDHHNDQFAGWRHPVDGKWHLLQWDGDVSAFMPDNLLDRVTHSGPAPGIYPSYLNPQDTIPDTTAVLADNPDSENVLRDTLPHEYLKFHPQYRAQFDRRLRELLLAAPSTSPPAGAGAFTQANIFSRFDRMAGDIRKTLEAEIMRWGERSPENLALHNPGSDPAPLRTAWVDRINTIRFTPDSGIPAEAHLPLARANLKTAARWSRLLNDIPPPMIEWNPTTRVAKATRGGSVGHVYILGGENVPRDPVDEPSSPDYTFFNPASEQYAVPSTQKIITARVYGPDIDNAAGWSALSVYVIP